MPLIKYISNYRLKDSEDDPEQISLLSGWWDRWSSKKFKWQHGGHLVGRPATEHLGCNFSLSPAQKSFILVQFSLSRSTSSVCEDCTCLWHYGENLKLSPTVFTSLDTSHSLHQNFTKSLFPGCHSGPDHWTCVRLPHQPCHHCRTDHWCQGSSTR